MNSRPLTFVSDEFDSSRPLTPSHFLTEKVAGVHLPVVNDSGDLSVSSLTERELQRQSLLTSSGVCGRLIILGTCHIM